MNNSDSYISKYFSCEQIDQRLLQGYYDDFVEITGYIGTKEEFLSDIFACIAFSTDRRNITIPTNTGIQKFSKWSPNTTYTKGTIVLSPENILFQCNIDHTSGDIFDQLLWVNTDLYSIIRELQSQINNLSQTQLGKTIVNVNTIIDEDADGYENVVEFSGKTALELFGDRDYLLNSLNNGFVYLDYLGDISEVVSTFSASDNQIILRAFCGGYSIEIQIMYDNNGSPTKGSGIYHSVAAKSEYASNIEDKTLTMPNAVGGIAKGTKVSALEGKTFNEIFDDLLFPTVNPTFTAPSATIALNGYAAVQIVGSPGPVAQDFKTTFNAGAINLNGVKQNNRAGALDTGNSFIYIDGDTGDHVTNDSSDVFLGNTSYTYRAAYAAGSQPKDNKGNNYSTPLAAGYVDSKAVTVNGTYPWYASTATATSDNPVVKQALVAWNATAGSMSTGQFTLQPSGTLPQVFKLPRQLKTLQMLNTVSGAMDTIGISDYTETTEVIKIGGTDVTYYVYTYKGSTRGEVTLLAKF